MPYTLQEKIVQDAAFNCGPDAYMEEMEKPMKAAPRVSVDPA